MIDELIGTEFADYDTHLIYEVYNEVRLAKTDDEWNAQATNSKKAQKIMNEYAQAAVNAIRAVDKGYNESRFIFVPGYAASLAYDIDNGDIEGVLGTIAGDDTLLMILAEDANRQEIKHILEPIISSL